MGEMKKKYPKVCNTCKYFYEPDGGGRYPRCECRKYSPKDFQGGFPQTYPKSWCGEWELAERLEQ